MTKKDNDIRYRFPQSQNNTIDTSARWDEFFSQLDQRQLAYVHRSTLTDGSHVYIFTLLDY